MKRRILATATLLVAGALCAAPRPAADNSVNALLETGDEGAADYARFSRLFGTDEVIVLRLEHPKLELLLEEVTALTELLQEEETVERVLSAETAYASELALLTDEEMGGLAELERLAPRFEGPLNRALGLIRPTAHQATLFALGKIADPAKREPLAAALDAKRRAFEEAGGRALIAGPPLLNLELDRAAKKVEQRALPALIAVAVLFLLISTRSVTLTLAVLAPVGLGVFATEGILGLTGATTNIIVDITKPLLLVLLLASGLHLAVGFQDARRHDQSPDDASASAVRTKGRAITLALFTTSIGFSSLAISPIAPIRTFGILSAVGLLFGIPLTLWLLPALLSLVGARVRPIHEGILERASLGAVRFGLRHRVPILLFAGIGVVIGLGSITQLHSDPHAIDYFPKKHPLRADYEAMEAEGLGLSTVEVVLTSTIPFDRSAHLERLDRIAREAAKLPGVRDAVSLPLFLREANFRSTGRDALPSQLVVDRALKEKAELLSDFISEDRRKARVSLMIGTLDAGALDTLADRVKQLVAEEAPSTEVAVTGNYRLLLEAQRSLIATLIESLLTTALLMELVLLLLLRSVRLALAALIPNILPVALNFLLMVLARIPLDLGTAMTGAIALGIAVDDTLHFAVAWRKQGAEPAARSTGRALTMTSMVIGAGFLALAPSEFGPTRNFGLLAGATMATALLADLLVLPPLLELTKRDG